MTTRKDFTVTNNNGTVVFVGKGGDANAWATRNVHAYGDLFVHYDNGVNVLHWFVGPIADMWGVHNGVTNEWVA